uniref:Claudin n=1 Tax=Astyanax mexicanus TaxID=7994 RepID=A0A3B1KJK7_ASTMX
MGRQLLAVFLAVIGFLGTILICALPMWKVSAFVGANIVTAQVFWEGLWMNCVMQSTGQMQCKVYDSILYAFFFLFFLNLFGISGEPFFFLVTTGLLVSCYKNQVGLEKRKTGFSVSDKDEDTDSSLLFFDLENIKWGQ